VLAHEGLRHIERIDELVDAIRVVREELNHREPHGGRKGSKEITGRLIGLKGWVRDCEALLTVDLSWHRPHRPMQICDLDNSGPARFAAWSEARGWPPERLGPRSAGREMADAQIGHSIARLVKSIGGGDLGMAGRMQRALMAFGVALAVSLTGCSVGTPTALSGAKLDVVAAENFWGSLASQLGGSKVSVTSIIDNPNADPHDYEPTAADARLIASANFVIENGVGYDPWAQRLVDANPVSGRDVLNVGTLVGEPPGGNPHRWYSPTDVQHVIDAITAEYKKLDPKDASYFDHQRSTFETDGLAQYHAIISEIKTKYAGTPVGASESIFALMAPALGLKLLTPPSFLTAISEGTEPTAAEKAAIDHQISSHEIKVYVYNSQNATPDVQRQIEEARAVGIPITTITETLVPAGATFQAWQVAQLQSLATALHQATGK
jgi:zinc/manganese transport system substrate-binding protein